MKYREVEFKYLADEISLKQFEAFCLERKPKAAFVTSGWDHFYSNEKDPDTFCRHRWEYKKFNQLSFKRKTTDKNNFVRTEHNIDLAQYVTPDQVRALCAEFGYKYNSAIFKNCFIYTYEDYTLVFYVVYDEAMKEVGRFVEIEVSEEFPWKDDAHAMERLCQLESELAPTGVSPRCRTKKSLFERYRK